MSKKLVQVFLERRALSYEGTLMNVGQGNPQLLRPRFRVLLTERDTRRLESMRAEGAQTPLQRRTHHTSDLHRGRDPRLRAVQRSLGGRGRHHAGLLRRQGQDALRRGPAHPRRADRGQGRIPPGDVVKLITANTRAPDDVEGDLLAHAEATKVAERVPFGEMGWIDDAPSIRAPETEVEGTRWAIVECGEGILREDWCAEGHRGYVISEGEAFRLPPVALGGGAHHGRNIAPGPTRLFLIDG